MTDCWKSIDLFSGIGGIAHAFDGIAQPVAMCEKDPARRHILQTHFGTCDPPPQMFDDVQTFSNKTLDTLMSRHGPIDLVAGGWPCFLAGTLVLTDAGYRPIERINGRLQKVMSHTGHLRRIINRQITQYHGPMVYIFTEHGDAPLTCTADHPVFARTGHNATPSWVRADQLIPGSHYVGLPLTGVYTKYSAPDVSVYGRAIEDQRHLAHAGHPQSIYEDGRAWGGECARGDVLIDEHFCWFRVVDIERSTESCAVYNMEVDVDHSYIVQNIAVSNCKGFSVVGRRNGFAHAESALFKEFARIALHVRPRLIFQENVPAVSKQMELMQTVFGEDYIIRWMILPAYAVGAHHTRKRWFCLCIRRDQDLAALQQAMTQVQPPHTPHSFELQPPRMITPGTDGLSITQRRAKLSMLGDSVVPACVRKAFLTLCTGVYDDQVCFDATCATDDLVHATPHIAEPISRKLLMDPAAYVSPIPLKTGRYDRVLTTPVPYTLWRTPRAQQLGAARYLTQRTHRDLYTQVRFERDTTNRDGVVNVEWVTTLMGYPENWLAENSAQNDVGEEQ